MARDNKVMEALGTFMKEWDGVNTVLTPKRAPTVPASYG
jgi:hypothetical protein